MRILYVVCFFKQKSAYDVRISDWSSDVCSSDLERLADRAVHFRLGPRVELQAELAEHVDQNREIRRPNEIRIGREEEEKIGRAECRERECQDVEILMVVVEVKKKSMDCTDSSKHSHTTANTTQKIAHTA